MKRAAEETSDDVAPTARPRSASPELKSAEGERDLVAALISDHLLAFKDASAAVGIPWNDRADGATSKLAEQLDVVLQRTDAVGELCKALRGELLREVTDEGREKVAVAFRAACIQTHVVYNVQLDRVHGTQGEVNTLLANAGLSGGADGRAPGLDLAEEAEPLVERFVHELACDVADSFFTAGHDAPIDVLDEDAESLSSGEEDEGGEAGEDEDEEDIADSDGSDDSEEDEDDRSNESEDDSDVESDIESASGEGTSDDVGSGESGDDDEDDIPK